MSKSAQGIWIGLLAFLIAVAAVFAVYTVGAVGVLLAWNLGVYGLAPAVGLAVSKIGFWTAFGTSALVFTLRYVFGGKGLALENAEVKYYNTRAKLAAATLKH
jgi:hypothetical protein